MRKTVQSFGHAVDGLLHALRLERNLRLFTIGFVFVLFCGAFASLPMLEWTMLIISGLTFISVELLNTALERLVDAVDECRNKGHGPGYHRGLKATKDVASAASLVCLAMNLCVMVIVFWPFLIKLTEKIPY